MQTLSLFWPLEVWGLEFSCCRDQNENILVCPSKPKLPFMIFVFKLIYPTECMGRLFSIKNISITSHLQYSSERLSGSWTQKKDNFKFKLVIGAIVFFNTIFAWHLQLSTSLGSLHELKTIQNFSFKVY